MFCEGGEERKHSIAEARRILYSEVGDEHYNLSSIFREHPDKAVKFAIATFGIPQFCKDNWDDGKKQSQDGKAAQPEAASSNGGTSPPTNEASAAKPLDDNHSTDNKPPSSKKKRRPRARRKKKSRAGKSTGKRARAKADDMPSKPQNGQESGTAGARVGQSSPGAKRAYTCSDAPSRPQKRQRVAMQVAGTTEKRNGQPAAS
ncbi:hypothetical protein GGI35DRAFT_461871 [Trichoderma velutinum]